MNSGYQFVYIHDEPEQLPINVTFEMSGESTWTNLADRFLLYLKAVGFSLDENDIAEYYSGGRSRYDEI